VNNGLNRWYPAIFSFTMHSPSAAIFGVGGSLKNDNTGLSAWCVKIINFCKLILLFVRFDWRLVVHPAIRQREQDHHRWELEPCDVNVEYKRKKKCICWWPREWERYDDHHDNDDDDWH